jgi:cytochrome P450
MASAKLPDLADPSDLSRFDFLPFGHGRYSCPGNVFAMNEMLLFLSMMFHNFAMRLVNTIPSPDLTKMVFDAASVASVAVCKGFLHI